MNYGARRTSDQAHSARIGTMVEHSRGSVLVVDDEPTIAEVVARYLERAGYRTRIAADGIGAIVVEDTPRRHAERALRRSGADYRAIVE